MRRLLIRLLPLIVTLPAFAQTPLDLEQGLKPFGSYQAGNIDTVNLSNGNVMLNIPLLSYPQRGSSLTLNYVLSYNDKNFELNESCDPISGTCTDAWTVNSNVIGGPTLGVQVIDPQQASSQFEIQNLSPDPSNPEYQYFYQVVQPDQSTHDMAILASNSALTRTADATGYLATVPSSGNVTSVIDRNGITFTSFYDSQHQTQYRYRTDSNGDVITYSAHVGQGFNPWSATDTLGRVLSAPLNIPTQASGANYVATTAPGLPTSDFSSCTGPLPTVAALLANMPTPNGGTGNYKFCYANVNVATYFHTPSAFNVGGYVFEGGGVWEVLQSVVLPNGTAWTFEYSSVDPGDPAGTNYGDLTKITFPTGGTLAYTYVNIPGCFQAMSRSVAIRTLDANDGLGPHTWQYSYTQNSTKVTDPAGNDTLHTFTQLDAKCSEFETSTQWFQGPQSPANLLRSSTTSYSSFLDVFNTSQINSAYNVIKTQETTAWHDGQTTQEKYTYDSSAATRDGHTLSFGNRTGISEYDFGSGAPGALLRQTATTYQAQVNTSYLNANLIDLPATSKVLDSSGNRCAETDYSYDEAAYLTGASISTQHVAPPQGLRGNASTVTHWLSSNSLNGASCNAAASWSTFASHTNWFDTGEAYQAIDPLTHTTTYAYDPAYASAYLTKTTNALGHVTSGTYDFNTGLLTSFTDANATQQAVGNTPGDPNHTTFYSYDSMERITGVTYPDGGHTSFDYNGDPVPPHITQSQTATPDPTIVHDSFYDGLGRLTRSQLTSDPEGVDYTDTTYDGLGRVASVSNPYRATSDPTYGVTSYAYDALGRTTTLTRQDGNTVQTNYANFPTVVTADETGRQRQSTTDALGRLVQVVEPNPTTGSLTTNSMPTYYSYDALGNLTNVNQLGDWTAPRVRSFAYDSLSRLLTAQNPESGTTIYGYDADSSLTSKTDARGVTTTYAPDALHRIITVSYGDGTPSEGFNYDLTTEWGQTISNPIGRLVSQNRAGAAPAQRFQYDAMGRVVQQEDCLPSGTCRLLSAAYDLGGHLNSLTYPSGRLVNYSYTAAGRLLSSTFTSWNGQPIGYNYITVPQSGNSSQWGYWPDGALRTGNFGNGMQQVYTRNTRLQENQYSVASAAQTWMSKTYSLYDCCGHDNGNVLTITDNLAASRTQQYGYDFLNNISMALQNDGSFNQTFGTDPWGNIKQFGTAAFSPNFDANNRISEAGYSYDAAGNLLTDSFHAYAYDAESRIKTLDTNGAAYTYSADGERVRKDAAGSATEYINFNGEPIAERNAVTGDWSDYIFANGTRVAKADTFENGILLQGTNCSNCGAQVTWFKLNDAQYLSGHTIQAGDKLYWRQAQSARGGMGIFFRDGTNNVWHSVDQYGNYTNDDTHQNDWYARIVDLSSFAGKVIDWIGLDNDSNSPAGAWWIVYGDISLIGSDGTVYPIYNGSANFSVSFAFGSSGVSGISSTNRHISNIGWATFTTTNYYHDDALGTSRMLTSYWGWPIWQGTFAPFGQEANPQLTTNHYKFTGKERDAESNLDYFGARYYSSTQGRWLSPDWADKPEAVPYADLSDPQSLNLYSYVRNNPMSRADKDGHDETDVLKGVAYHGNGLSRMHSHHLRWGRCLRGV